MTEALDLLQNLGRLCEHVRVAFVGPSGCRDALASRFRTMKATSLRPWVLLNYARLTRLVHDVRSGAGESNVWSFPSVAEVQRATKVAKESLIGKARHIDDMRVEQYVMNQLSDVGAVRSGVGATIEDKAQQEGSVIVSRSVVADGAGGAGHDELDALLAIEKATTQEAPAGQAMAELRISRSNVPLNDYTQNGLLLSGGFWWLFPLQVLRACAQTHNPVVFCCSDI